MQPTKGAQGELKFGPAYKGACREVHVRAAPSQQPEDIGVVTPRRHEQRRGAVRARVVDGGFKSSNIKRTTSVCPFWAATRSGVLLSEGFWKGGALKSGCALPAGSSRLTAAASPAEHAL